MVCEEHNYFILFTFHVETYEQIQLSMNRDALLQYLQRATKLVIVDSVSGGTAQLITDANINVAMLCDALSRILSFGLKKSLFSRTPPSLWSVLSSIDSALVGDETLTFIRNEFADDATRATAWLLSLLIDRRICSSCLRATHRNETGVGTRSTVDCLATFVGASSRTTASRSTLKSTRFCGAPMTATFCKRS